MKYPFQAIRTVQDCASLGEVLGNGPVIALWSTTEPRPTVDVLLHLYERLHDKGYQTIFFVRQDALEIVAEQCPKALLGRVFGFDDIALLAYCPFISLLISHDYCMREKPPQAFSGNVLLMPHNIHTPNPHAGNFWADYIVTPNTLSGIYSYSFLPNRIKIHRSPVLSMIPCGYPKLDLLIQARKEAGPGPHHVAAFYPGALWYSMGQDRAKAALSLRRWRELVDEFFMVYPDWTFVLRPYKEDREHFIFQELFRRYGDRQNFIFDTGTDNKRYLTGCDIFITDYSAVEYNFPFATLQPSIVLSLDAHGPEHFTVGEVGYTAYTGRQAVLAMADALGKKEFWKERIVSLRNEKIPFAGKSYAYLCDHMDDILAGHTQPEWVLFDKGDTPYTTVKEWVMLFSKRSGLKTQGIPSQYFIWSREILGDNEKIALAFLRYALRIMPTLAKGQNRYLLTGIESCIQSLLRYLGHRYAWGLLWHIAHKEPGNRFALFWLIVVTFRQDASERQRQCVVALLRDNTLSSREMQALYAYVADKAMLFPVLDQFAGAIASPEIFFHYSLLLLNKGRPHEAEKVLKTWEESVGVDDTYRQHHEMVLSLCRQSVNEKIPCFFSYNGKYTVNICGVPVSFDSKKDAVKFFGNDVVGILQYGENHFAYKFAEIFKIIKSSWIMMMKNIYNKLGMRHHEL